MIDMICLVQIDFWLTVWKFSVEIAQCGKMKNLVSPKNISSNQLFSNFFKNVTFTNFLPKMCETKSQQFPLCDVLTLAQCGKTRYFLPQRK